MAEATDAVFVGIDAGTNGVTVALFDQRGRELATADVGYPCQFPHPGWSEQDMEQVWLGICQASRAARAQCDLPDEAFRSLGFSSQRGTFVLLDEDEQPLAPAVVWNDSRAKDMEDWLLARIDPARYRELSGMTLSASWAVAKIAWLWRHRAELKDRTRWISNGQEYFLRRLGADRLESDPASLTLNGMLDIRRLDWSLEICRAADIDPALLPPVGRTATQVGRLSRQAARETGLPEGEHA